MTRRGVRALCKVRLRDIDHGSREKNHEAKLQWIEGVKARGDIADVPEKANEQHYEVGLPSLSGPNPFIDCP